MIPVYETLEWAKPKQISDWASSGMERTDCKGTQKLFQKDGNIPHHAYGGDYTIIINLSELIKFNI